MSEFSVPLQHSCARFKLGCRCASPACVSLDTRRFAYLPCVPPTCKLSKACSVDTAAVVHGKPCLAELLAARRGSNLAQKEFIVFGGGTCGYDLAGAKNPTSNAV